MVHLHVIISVNDFFFFFDEYRFTGSNATPYQTDECKIISNTSLD